LKIKAVIFDIDNTLWDTKKFAAMARREALRAMMKAGLKKYAGAARAETELEKIISRRGANYHHHFDELCRRVAGRVEPKIVASGVAAYHKEKWKMGPFAEARGVLRALRRRGVRVFAATEGIVMKQWDKLVRLGLADEFEDVFVSEGVGVDKVRGMFAHILRRKGLEAGEVVVVGDAYDRDVAPARKIGMAALLVRRTGRKTKNVISNLREVLRYVGRK